MQYPAWELYSPARMLQARVQVVPDLSRDAMFSMVSQFQTGHYFHVHFQRPTAVDLCGLLGRLKGVFPWVGSFVGAPAKCSLATEVQGR